MHTKEEKLKAFAEALDIMETLRAKCPWNAAQTTQSLRPMTVEEVYELSDAVLRGDDKDLRKELGDVLLHIIFYARIAEEEGRCLVIRPEDKIPIGHISHDASQMRLVYEQGRRVGEKYLDRIKAFYE